MLSGHPEQRAGALQDGANGSVWNCVTAAGAPSIPSSIFKSRQGNSAGNKGKGLLMDRVDQARAYLRAVVDLLFLGVEATAALSAGLFRTTRCALRLNDRTKD